MTRSAPHSSSDARAPSRRLTDMVGGGPFGLKPGQWTDDTSMALCLAESLLECGGFDPVDQLKRYVRWYREGHHSSTGRCFDIGNTVRDALSGLSVPASRGAAAPTRTRPGNGSLMRLAPVPLFFAAIRTRPSPARRTARGRRTARPKRSTPAATLRPDYWSAAGVTKEDLLQPMFTPVPGLWDREPLSPKIANVARGSFLRNGPPDIRGTGYVVESIEAALWAFARSTTFDRARCSRSTLATMRIRLARSTASSRERFYGVEAIPDAWRSKLTARETLETFASRLVTPA